MARIDYRNGAFVGLGTFEELKIWKRAGFEVDHLSRPKVWVAPSLAAALLVQGVTWTDTAIAAANLQSAEAENAIDMSFKGSTEFDPPVSDAVRAKGWDFKPFQKAGIEYAIQPGREDTLIGDQPGLGKTIQAVGVANSLGVVTADPVARRILVVAPASLKENWRREWSLWQTHERSVGIAEASFDEKVQDGFYKNGKPRFRKVTHTNVWPNTDVVIINYEILERFTDLIAGTSWDLLVCDECHALKSPDSIRTLFVLGGMQKPNKKKGRPKPIWWKAIDAPRRVFLSGTPMMSRPSEFWPIVKAFDPRDLGRNEDAYAYRYCGAYLTHHGLDKSGATNLEELGEKLRSKFMVRRLKREVLPELPPKTRIVIPLDSKEIREVVAREDELAQSLRLFEQMVAGNTGLDALNESLQGLQVNERIAGLKFAEAMGDGDDVVPNWRRLDMDYATAVLGLDPPAVAVAFEEIALVRRELGIAKLSAVIPWCKDFLDGGEKLVLFGYHTDVVEALIQGLGRYDPAYIYGKVPQRQRQWMVDRFQDDEKCRVIIGNIHAMGVGHTLTRASDVAFAEGDWTPAMMEQCEDRVLRIGQTADKVMSFALVANGSLDARIAQAAKAKEDNIAKVIG